MRVEEIGGREALTAAGEAWRELQMRCPDATPFQTWEWNTAWWRHFGARKRPRLVLVYGQEAGRETLLGLAPLYTSRHLGTPLRRLAWIGTGQSDYLGPLAAPRHQEAVASALLRHLHTHMRGWDVADLQQLRQDAPLACVAPEEWPDRPRDSLALLPMEPCPYLALPDRWDTFTGRLGKSLRKNLGYYERLLTRTFEDAEIWTADASTLDGGMTALFALHQQRWNARWLPGVLGSQRVQAFHRDAAARFLERGWLRLHLLRCNGEIRAALYCFALHSRTFYYIGGFAPDLAKYSLGTLLTGRAIRQAIDEGCAEFDFLRGDESYKYRWLPAERVNARLLLLRPGRALGPLGELPGRAGLALNSVERFVAHHALKFAERQKTRTGEKSPATPDNSDGG